MEALYFDDLEPIDFLQNADNVYRTEEYIVKQKLSLSRDKNLDTLHLAVHITDSGPERRSASRRAAIYLGRSIQ